METAAIVIGCLLLLTPIPLILRRDHRIGHAQVDIDRRRGSPDHRELVRAAERWRHEDRP